MLRSFITILILLSFATNAYPCSSFQLRDSQSYIGKSYDWRFGDGLIIYNPSGLKKFSLTLNAADKKTQWVSKYSSLTYNQYGLDFPNGGMNDEGLTIEVLWLDESIYPAQDEKPILNELQWIQYALDTQSTLAGVAETFNQIRIKPVYAKVHYFVCDKNNDCATFEFVNGELVIGDYEKFGFEVITNSTHKDSGKYLRKFKHFGGKDDIIWGTYNSLDRFARINELLRAYKHQEPITYSFDVLDSVKREPTTEGNYTQWQIVYDKENLISHFKTFFGNKSSGTVNLREFPISCHDRYYFDLDNSQRGEINTEFKPLTFEINHAHVKKTLLKIMPQAPENMITAIAGAPFKFECAQ